MVRVRVFVSGKVQGVAFRAHTQAMARESGVSGWVRNLSDGRVEAVFEGEMKAVDHVVHWCNQGSPSAQVTEVQGVVELPEGLTDFEIKPSP